MQKKKPESERGYGRTGADWLLLDRGIELRHVNYDLKAAANFVRQSSYPQAEEIAHSSILNPPSKDKMLPAMTNISFS